MAAADAVTPIKFEHDYSRRISRALLTPEDHLLLLTPWTPVLRDTSLPSVNLTPGRTEDPS